MSHINRLNAFYGVYSSPDDPSVALAKFDHLIAFTNEELSDLRTEDPDADWFARPALRIRENYSDVIVDLNAEPQPIVTRTVSASVPPDSPKEKGEQAQWHDESLREFFNRAWWNHPHWRRRQPVYETPILSFNCNEGSTSQTNLSQIDLLLHPRAAKVWVKALSDFTTIYPPDQESNPRQYDRFCGKLSLCPPDVRRWKNGSIELAFSSTGELTDIIVTFTDLQYRLAENTRILCDESFPSDPETKARLALMSNISKEEWEILSSLLLHETDLPGTTIIRQLGKIESFLKTCRETYVSELSEDEFEDVSDLDDDAEFPEGSEEINARSRQLNPALSALLKSLNNMLKPQD